MRKAGLRPEQQPRYKRDHRNRDDCRHEPGCHPVSNSLNRRPAALRLADRAHDLRQQRFAAYVFGAHDERTCSVDRSANDPSARFLHHRQGFAGDHGLIYAAVSFQDHSVNRYLLARTHAQPITRLHLLERNVLFPFIMQQSRRLRTQVQQRPNSGTGAATRPQFQNLPQQNQRCNRCRSFKIDGRFPIHSAKRFRKDPRKQRSH